MIFISIVGPTSSGKSDLAVDLALHLSKLNKRSVVISADSRQVYKYLNLGTGKIEGEWYKDTRYGNCYKYKDVPHFLIDYIDLDKKYSLFEFLKDYCNLFLNWEQTSVLPDYVILCGGTGYFASAVADELQLDQYKDSFANEVQDLQKSLSLLSAPELKSRLDLINSDWESHLNPSDQNNPRRLQNLILRTEAKNRNWLIEKKIIYPKFEAKYEFLLDCPDLEDRIRVRLEKRLNSGMIEETLDLLESGLLNYEKLDELGLEYKLQKQYFLGLISYAELVKLLFLENRHLVKKQHTWSKKQANLIPVNSLPDILEKMSM